MPDSEAKHESKCPEGTIGWAMEQVALGHTVRRRGDWIATIDITNGGNRDMREPFSKLQDFLGLPFTTDVFFAADWEIIKPRGIIEVLWFSRR